MRDKKLKDKVVMITGASRNIGLETARMCADEGASLIMTEIPSLMEDLVREANKIKDEFEVNTLPLELDVLEIEKIEDKVFKAIEEIGNIDVLVNNAGVNSLNNVFSITPEEWDFVLDTNLKGTFFVTQAVIKRMIEKKAGSVISISSQHGVVGNEMRAHYCSSKAGMINMARAMSVELSKYNIRVNTVSPTFVITDSNRELLNSRKFRKSALNNIPMGLYAEPKDIASAVLFLASDESRLITGHNLVVDGGWTAK